MYDQIFGFDLAYNRTNFEDMPPGNPFSYLFNTDNQNNSGGFMYDGSGNPTQYNSSASTYAYDPEQRLTGIGGSFTAHYDGDGMRDYTIVNGTTTYYVYDGSSPVLEETYSGSTTTIQVANGMADGWRERYAATSAGFNAYGFDPQGSLTVEDSSFNTTQPAQNVYVYDCYGNRLVGERVSNGSTTAFNIDPVQFGGQYGYYTDTSTGEVQLTHRYYDPSTGHFLNRDPIGYKGGQNLYAFYGNNPITGSDPSGDLAQTQPPDPTGDKWYPENFSQANARARVRGKQILAFLGDVANNIDTFERISEAYNYRAAVNLANSGSKLPFDNHQSSYFRGPAAKKFNWDHIYNNHSDEGEVAQQRIRQGAKRATFFTGMTKGQIRSQVEAAWRNRGSAIEIQELPGQDTRMRYRGVDPVSQKTIEFWLNKNTRTVETAYPVEP